MKVLKPGDGRKQPWRAELTCTGKGNAKIGCGALLQVEQSDLFLTGGGLDISGVPNDSFVTFQCVECGTLTDVPKEQRPPQWHELLYYREWKEKRARDAEQQLIAAMH